MRLYERKEQVTMYSNRGDVLRMSLDEFYSWVRENLPSTKGKSLRQIAIIVTDKDMLKMYKEGLGTLVKKGSLFRDEE